MTPKGLIKARQLLNMTQEELAKHLELSVRTLQRYEAAKPHDRHVVPTWLALAVSGLVANFSSQ